MRAEDEGERERRAHGSKENHIGFKWCKGQ